MRFSNYPSGLPHHHNWTLFNSMSNVSINKYFLIISHWNLGVVHFVLALNSNFSTLSALFRRNNFFPSGIFPCDMIHFTKLSLRQIFNVESHKGREESEVKWVRKEKRKTAAVRDGNEKEDKEEWLGPLNWKSHVFLKMMNGPSVRVEGNEMRDESPEIGELHVINARSSSRLKFFPLIEINFTSHLKLVTGILFLFLSVRFWQLYSSQVIFRRDSRRSKVQSVCKSV